MQHNGASPAPLLGGTQWWCIRQRLVTANCAAQWSPAPCWPAAGDHTLATIDIGNEPKANKSPLGARTPARPVRCMRGGAAAEALPCERSGPPQLLMANIRCRAGAIPNEAGAAAEARACMQLLVNACCIHSWRRVQRDEDLVSSRSAL